MKPKLQDAPVNARVLQDLENLLNENPKAFATDETEIGTTPLIEMDIEQVITHLLLKDLMY